jgi:small-conductance mechanosensitive channel
MMMLACNHAGRSTVLVVGEGPDTPTRPLVLPQTLAYAALMTVSSAAAMHAPIDQVRSIGRDAVGWIELHGGELLVAIAAGAAVYVLLRVIRRWVRGRAAVHPDISGIGATILRTLARTRHFFLIMVAARLVVGYASAPVLIDQTVRFLFIVAVALQAAIWAREVVMSLVRHRASETQNETLANAMAVINVLVSISLFAVAVIVVLDNVGVNVTGLIAGLGIGGIAIGLAAKGIFEDLFAALAIIFDRPFRKGESIRFDQTTATVERIGLKSTRLRALTGEEVVISNTNLLSKQLSNFARQSHRRMTLPVALTYETPVEKLRAVPDIVRAAITEHGGEFIRCGMTGFGTSSIDFDIQFDVRSEDYDVVFHTRHSIGLSLIDRFAAEGIRFAYPAQVSFTAAPDGSLIMPYPQEPRDQG